MRPHPLPGARDRLGWFRDAPATKTLVVVCCAVFALQLADRGVLEDLFAKVNERILAGEAWRLFTASLLHGGPAHLAFNSLALLSVGPPVERLYGRARFAAIFFLGGAAGYAASVALVPAPSVGASAGIFALLGALLAFAIRWGRRLGSEGRRLMIREIAVVVGLNLALGLTAGFIDIAAHVGGLAGGFALGLVLRAGGGARPAPPPPAP